MLFTHSNKVRLKLHRLSRNALCLSSTEWTHFVLNISDIGQGIWKVLVKIR
jgi:hypothetical protein